MTLREQLMAGTVFTVHFNALDQSFTYQIAERDGQEDKLFVSGLAGHGDKRRMAYIGTIRNRRAFRPGAWERIPNDSMLTMAFQNIWKRLDTLPMGISITLQAA